MTSPENRFVLIASGRSLAERGHRQRFLLPSSEKGIYLGIYRKEPTMQTAKLFANGRSQAVRLPKDCRFSGDEVYVKRLENIVILIPKEEPWASLVDSLDRFSEDFMEERNQPDDQTREKL